MTAFAVQHAHTARTRRARGAPTHTHTHTHMPFALQAGGTLRVLDLFAERAKRSGPLRPSFIEQYDCVIISYDHLGKELYHAKAQQCVGKPGCGIGLPFTRALACSTAPFSPVSRARPLFPQLGAAQAALQASGQRAEHFALVAALPGRGPQARSWRRREDYDGTVRGADAGRL